VGSQKKNASRLAKYSGLAFQLLVFIGLGYFLGNLVDEKYSFGQPYGAAFGATLFLILGMVYIIRDVLRENKS